jgi:hypothetical protein
MPDEKEILESGKTDVATETSEQQQQVEEEVKKVEESTSGEESTALPEVLSDDAEIEDFDKKLEELKKSVQIKSEDNEELSQKEEDKPSAIVEEDKTKAKSTIKIDNAYIESQPENIRGILQGMKGKREFIEIDSQIAKNYIYSQLHIKDLESKQEDLSKSPTFDKIKTSDDDKTFIDDLTHQKLKVMFPNLPDTAEDIKQFEADLMVDDPREFQKYLSSEQKIREDVENNRKKEIYMKQNQNELAEKAVQKAQAMFLESLVNEGIVEPDKLLKTNKIDFSTFDEKGTNQALTDLIWDASIPLPVPVRKFGGNGDPMDFSDKNASYLIDPSLLMMRAKYKYGPAIIKSHIQSISQKSYEDGLKKRIEKENSINPSASISGSATLEAKKKDSPIISGDDQTIEEMEANLEKIKEKVRNKMKQ